MSQCVLVCPDDQLPLFMQKMELVNFKKICHMSTRFPLKDPQEELLHSGDKRPSQHVSFDKQKLKPSAYKIICKELSPKERKKHIQLFFIWVFPKIGVTPKWMVYNGKPY